MSPARQRPFRPTRRALLAAAGAGFAWTLGRRAHAAPVDSRARPAADSVAAVDLQLVLAVDASGSVSPRRFELQQRGYVDAFRNPRVQKAIQSGLAGAIALTMFQWTGPRLQAMTFGWRRISSVQSALELAGQLEREPRALFGGGTSISGAIDYGRALFQTCPYPSSRRVIDVSGDGANTSGRPVSLARDEAVATGVVINGLPILAIEFDLDRHFAEDVIGGPGAFMIVAQDFDTFGAAVARKLVQEISSAGSCSRPG